MPGFSITRSRTKHVVTTSPNGRSLGWSSQVASATCSTTTVSSASRAASSGSTPRASSPGRITATRSSRFCASRSRRAGSAATRSRRRRTSSQRPSNRTAATWRSPCSRLAVHAGYRVVAAASPKSFERVRDLGAAEVFDYHDRAVADEIVAALRGHALAGTVAIGQGSLTPALRIARHSDGSRRVASAYPGPVTALRKQVARSYGVRVSAIWGGDPARTAIGPAVFRDFLPAALADGRYRTSPVAEVIGHELGAVPAGLARLRAGVSAPKLVVGLDAWPS